MSRNKFGQLVSPRNIPLVYQCVENVPVVTVEAHCKWYTLYVIKPDETVRGLTGEELTEIHTRASEISTCLPWVDHLFHPAMLEAAAKYIGNGAVVCELSLELATGRYVNDRGIEWDTKWLDYQMDKINE